MASFHLSGLLVPLWLVIGWVNVGQWGHQNAMIIWTISTVAAIVLEVFVSVVDAMLNPALAAILLTF